MPRVVVDIQGTQSVDHRDRGIARYITDLASGLASVAADTVEAFAFNPDLPLPGGIEPLVASGKLVAIPDVAFDASTILHIASPIELAVPPDRVLPPAARDAGAAVVVTLFDLIPAIFPERYLTQPGIRRRYYTRLELVRSADRVLAISTATAQDATRLLGIPPERIDVIPLAASNRFVPAADRDSARAVARALVPGLRDRFVLYNGGQDFRKNMESLVDGWTAVPARVRAGRQLVLACALDEPTQNHFNVLAQQRGLDVLVTGYVTDDALVALNQAAELVVFPSLYEGFGLPVVEALACGTPAVAANTSSLPELLPEQATFDPTSPGAIASGIARGLTDASLRTEVVEAHHRRRMSEVVTDTVAAYERAAKARDEGPIRRRRRRDRPRVALCTPLPPVPGGVSDFSARLLETLPDLVDVDVFVDGPPHRRAAIERATSGADDRRPLAALDAIEAAQGAYDRVLLTLGNSEYHTGALAALLRRGGVALAHEVRLVNLYRFARWQHPEAVPGGFAATLHGMYDGLPAHLGEDEQIDPSDAERWGVFMARDAISASSSFFVTSPFAAELARLDARPHDRDKVRALPFAMGAVAGDPWPTRGQEDREPLVVSFGGISALKQTALLIDAFAHAARSVRKARLVLVGAVNEEVQAAVDAAAGRSGVRGRVLTTGDVDPETYRSWLARAWVAVQLRATTNGESSGATGDCFAAGVPTILTGIGAARATPGTAGVQVSPDVGAVGLGDEIAALLRDGDRRASLSAGALAHARQHTYAAAARALVDALFD